VGPSPAWPLDRPLAAREPPAPSMPIHLFAAMPKRRLRQIPSLVPVRGQCSDRHLFFSTTKRWAVFAEAPHVQALKELTVLQVPSRSKRRDGIAAGIPEAIALVALVRRLREHRNPRRCRHTATLCSREKQCMEPHGLPATGGLAEQFPLTPHAGTRN